VGKGKRKSSLMCLQGRKPVGRSDFFPFATKKLIVEAEGKFKVEKRKVDCAN